MAEPKGKKEHRSKPKHSSKPFSSQAPTTITTAKSTADPRFASIQNDPRYRLPSKRHGRVKVDKRFAQMLKDEDFTRKAKVDRYGRPLEAESERKRLKRKYEFDGEIDESGEDDEVVVRELKRAEEKAYDPIRGIGLDEDDSSSSSSEDEEELEDDEEEDLDQAAQGRDVPMGEASRRIAVVNLDWDHIRATDLMAVFSSFLPAGGRLEKVTVYPSEFGRERMEREEMEGPPRELFVSKKKQGAAIKDDELAEEDEDDEEIKKSIIKPDTGEEFDSAKLRKYQLERLRYYYAVLIFSSTSVAHTIYEAVDGTEYLSTANFFDLRFIPDETEFSTDTPRDECDRIPEGYKPNEFVTDALQHSKVKLTWDADDNTRKEAQAKAFRGGRKEIDENDLKAYLGSDSSESEDEPGETEAAEAQPAPKLSKKEKEKQRLRALLGLGAEPAKKSKSDGPVGEVQITFSSGLTSDGKKSSVFANEPESNETTVEKYVRKERERKLRRKEKSKGLDTIGDTTAAVEAQDPMEDPEQQDLGFDDPFFTEPLNDTTANTAIRKAEKKKRREEREKEEAANAAQRAELELLMVDDQQTNIRHFNMNDIERAEKNQKKKNKHKNRKNKNKTNDDEVDIDPAAAAAATQDSFQIPLSDPRFARLYENHEFAIDPTNPKFKATSGMKALLEEGRKRRKVEEPDNDVGIRPSSFTDDRSGRGEKSALSNKKKKKKQKNDEGEDGNARVEREEDLGKLVQKVKARSRVNAL